MARTLSASVIAALAAGTVRPALFAQIGWSGSTTRLWSGLTDISWNGQTWLGTGDLLAVAPAAEATRVESAGGTITISGLNAALLSLALNNFQQGSAATVWLGFLDAAGAVIADPVIILSGRTDGLEITETPDGSTIRISVESELVELNRSNPLRYTPEDQAKLYAGDEGFDHVPGLVDWSGQWGSGPGMDPDRPRRWPPPVAPGIAAP